ncbi:MAG: energy transducer TonB [Flavobacteriales bacterium]
MKKRIMIIGTVLFAVGIISFINKGEAHNGNVENLGDISFKDTVPVNQDLRYGIRAKYRRPVQQETLKKAQLINDVISGYPENWITTYLSVEILATCNGKIMTAKSKNNVLTLEQKNILNAIDLNTDIIIHIKYKYDNPSTNSIENNEINVSMTVIPEVRAEYIIPDTEAKYEGERDYIREYLKENISKVPNDIEQCMVDFTINEEGGISNVSISMTSGKLEIDKLLVELVSKMPKWKPAQNSKGVNVKQEFQLTIGNAAIGC